MSKFSLHTLVWLTYAFSRTFSTLPKIQLEQFKWPEIKEKFNMTTHLKYEHIRRVCVSRYSVCKSNNASSVCAVRYVGGEFQYRDFINSCYLFLSNMCENPGNEHYILSDGTCHNYKTSRRDGEELVVTEESVQETTTIAASHEEETTTNTQALRGRATTAFSQLFKMLTAFDYHICSSSCPKVYQPVCVSANRGVGEYFKFFTFVNHCLGDQYFCAHPEEFKPPPDYDQDDFSVVGSKLSWSFCAASRYIQFARFSEVASSMGHYGWLLGDHGASHILDPAEKAALQGTG